MSGSLPSFGASMDPATRKATLDLDRRLRDGSAASAAIAADVATLTSDLAALDGRVDDLELSAFNFVGTDAERVALATMGNGDTFYCTDTFRTWVYGNGVWYVQSAYGETTSPTLTNATVGNGSARMEWTYSGGVGGGILVMAWDFLLGGSSTVGTSPYCQVPAGFGGDVSFGGVLPMGQCAMVDTSAGLVVYGTTRRLAGGTGYGPRRQLIGATDVADAAVTATAPWTWASGDSMSCYAVIRGVMT